DMREIMASRIWRAFQDLRSGRASQASRDRCTSPFRFPLKYQTRSNDSVHTTKVRAAIQYITGPPRSIKAPMAANASINACMSYLLLAFCVFGDDTCSLLIQNMNDTLGATVNQGVHQYNGDCNNQALYCGNQRCRDTARHVLGITSTEDGNSLEGFDHTGYGTQQTQKRCNSSDDLQYSQAAFDTGT